MYNQYSDDLSKNEVLKLVRQYENGRQSGESRFMENDIYIAIIEHYEHSNKFKEALAVAQTACIQHPYSSWFLVKSACFLAEIDNFEAAFEQIERAKAIDMSDPEILLTESKLVIASGDYQKGRFILEEMLDTVPLSEKTDYLLEIADVYVSRGESNLEFEMVVQALEYNPTNEDALERLAFCMEECDRYEEGVNIHKAITDEHPFCMRAWHNLGLSFSGLKLYEKAIDAFSYAIALQDSFAPAIQETAEAYYNLEEYDEALKYYLEALTFDGRNEELYYSIGYTHFHLDNYKKAFHYFDKAIKIDEHFAEAHFMVGEIQKKWGYYTDAFISYQKAIEIEETNSEYYQAYSSLSFEIGNHQTAIEFLFKALEQNANNKKTWLQLARIYYDLGYYYETLDVLQKAMELLENEPDILYIAFVSIYRLGKRSTAIEYLEQALVYSYDRHPIIFDWYPPLLDNQDLLMMIDQYKK